MEEGEVSCQSCIPEPWCNRIPGPVCVPAKEGHESQVSSENPALFPGPGIQDSPPLAFHPSLHGLVLQGQSRGRGEKAARKRRAFCLSMHRLPFLSGGKCSLLRFLFYYLKFSREQLPDCGNYLLSLF